jgi:methionyl-tRNA formyltransferase
MSSLWGIKTELNRSNFEQIDFETSIEVYLGYICKKTIMRIIFMGTPEFAIPSLDILIKNKYNVVGVVTTTDKFGGRNKSQLIESDIKKYAISKGIRILQPDKLRSPEFLQELKSLNADLQIVVAFRMLPEIVWNMPKLGTYNLHGSLLPKYRGAAPINWAIIRGETETGVSSFKLKHEIDTGDILLQNKIKIKADETAGGLHDRMKELAAQTVLRTVRRIEKGQVELMPQKKELATSAPKIFRENCKIEWQKPTGEVYNFIRGLSPYPAAWTLFGNKTFKIYEARPIIEKHDKNPGDIRTNGKDILQIMTLDGYISCSLVQLEGKKKMEVRSFLNGYNLLNQEYEQNIEQI